MELSLNLRTRRLIDRRVRSGVYARAEDVIDAALGSLVAQERFGGFAAGELDQLLAEGEGSIRKSGTLDGDTALRRRRQRRANRHRRSA